MYDDHITIDHVMCSRVSMFVVTQPAETSTYCTRKCNTLVDTHIYNRSMHIKILFGT